MPIIENRFAFLLTEKKPHVFGTASGAVQVPFSALVSHFQFRPSTGRYAQREKADVFTVVVTTDAGEQFAVASFSASAPAATFSVNAQLVLSSTSHVRQIALRRTFADPSTKKLLEEEDTPNADGSEGKVRDEHTFPGVFLTGVQLTTLTDEQVQALVGNPAE